MALSAEQGQTAVVAAPKVPGGPGFTPSAAHIAQFERDGVLVVANLFTAEEVELTRKIAKASPADSVIWLSADRHKRDVYNGYCHGRRIVNTLAELLGDEVYLCTCTVRSSLASLLPLTKSACCTQTTTR